MFWLQVSNLNNSRVLLKTRVLCPQGVRPIRGLFLPRRSIENDGSLTTKAVRSVLAVLRF